MPDNASQKKYGRCRRMSGHSLTNVLMANGKKSIAANDQRKKHRAIGGMSWYTARATMKFPDQIMVVRIAKNTPFKTFFSLNLVLVVSDVRSLAQIRLLFVLSGD